MDTSNRLGRLGIVFGQVAVKAEEIQPEEWFEIITTILNACRPQLQYFPGFKPIKGELSRHLHEYDYRTTDPGIVQCPEGFSLDTRCVLLGNIRFETDEINPSGPEFGVRFVTEESLFLTQKGRIVLWKRKYDRVARQGLGYRQHRTGTEDRAVECNFTFVEGSVLREILSAKVSGMIIDSLLALSSKGVEERKQRLGTMRSVEEFIIGIRERIEN